MSGGSFDYTCYEMESGEVAKFAMSGAAMAKRLEETLVKLRCGELQDWDVEAKQHVPYPRRTEAEIAIPAVLERFKLAAAHLATLAEMMRELAPIAHAIEWSCSGDSGRDDEANACVRWMHKRLGLDASKGDPR